MDARPSDDFSLRILTPMGEALEARAIALRVSAWDGQLGVLAHHAPMVAQLAIGPAVVTEPDGEKRWFAAANGVLRVTGDEVLLLVQAAEEAEEIDVERAQEALERAEHRLATREDATDISRAELALARAANRLKVAQHVSVGATR
ncbi:MAG: ATP synthase F1 subunit epsilon [Armatimonadia bacterium]|nr:ATP synthase F1 subunit epsilon [Armatimonadia bacterium]